MTDSVEQLLIKIWETQGSDTLLIFQPPHQSAYLYPFTTISKLGSHLGISEPTIKLPINNSYSQIRRLLNSGAVQIYGITTPFVSFDESLMYFMGSYFGFKTKSELDAAELADAISRTDALLRNYPLVQRYD